MRYVPTIVGAVLLLVAFGLAFFTPFQYMAGVVTLTGILLLAIGASIQK